MLENILSQILHYLLVWKPLGYTLAFVSMILEGEVLLIFFSFLTHQGYFDVRYMFLSLFFGSLTGDLIFYWIGYLIGKSSLSFPKWIHRLSHPLDRHLSIRPDKIIFISKFAYGTNRATLMRAGALRVNIWKFLRANVYAVFIWVLVIGGLGYLFGESINLVRNYVRFAQFVVLAVFVLFLVVFHLLFKKYEEKIE